MATAQGIRAATLEDLPALSALGLTEPVVMRAMAQQMAWVVSDQASITGGATARFADGTVFLDGLVGTDAAQLALIDHAIGYGRWSDAPALTVCGDPESADLEARGFVGLKQDSLPPDLAAACAGGPIMMKRL
ncbi:MAG: hypothetical protein KI785_14955 [Devosiaceae bacterium]|nr:hypothetical protein [Devosiaceae bacterium MH13]